MSMQDYLFFSYAKKLDPFDLKYREERKIGKQLTKGLRLTSASHSYLHSEKFRSDFGPSFDCMAAIGPHQYFIGQYARSDHNEKKTYAIVTFDSETHSFKTKYLSTKTPREGRFYRCALGGSVHDLHVSEEKIYVRHTSGDKEVLAEYPLEKPQFAANVSGRTKNRERHCSTKHPRLGQFLRNQFFYVSDDNTLCAFDFLSGHVQVVAPNVHFFAALDPDRLLLFTGRSCVLLFVQGPCLSDPIKEQIHRLQSFGRPGNASEEEKRHRLSKDLLEKNAYTHISFVPASKTGVKIGGTQTVTHAQSHDGLVYLALFDREARHNTLLFLRLAWEYSAASAYDPRQSYRVLRHRVACLGAKALERTGCTSPVTQTHPLRAELTGPDVKLCLFLEEAQYHLFFVCGATAGRLVANRAIGSEPDDEIYGCFSPTPSSIVLYGWNVCHEIKVCF